MKDGFLKAAAFSPALRVADCTYNAQQVLAQLQAAAQRGVKLAVFPEFCLTGYTCGDLFLQRTLQQGALDALEWLLAQTRALDTVVLVGLPLLVHGKLYNCAAVLCRGQLLGIVPKTYLPNYGEFYEKRQFTPGSTEVQTVTVCGQQVPFGTSLLFRCRQMPSFVLGVELCEDLWSALPPSTFHALAGATVIANLSASDETVGKAEYRRALVANQSARLLCGYLYASAGHGESTTDMVFAGHDLIAEDGSILAETAPFAGDHAETELDCQRMEAERARNTSFELSGEGYQTVVIERDEEGNRVLPEQKEGLSEDEVDDLVAEISFKSTDVGDWFVDYNKPSARLVDLLHLVPERTDTYIELLEFVEAAPRPYGQIEELLLGRSALQTVIDGRVETMQPSVFVDKLERAGALVWKKGWTLTEEGREFLEDLKVNGQA